MIKSKLIPVFLAVALQLAPLYRAILTTSEVLAGAPIVWRLLITTAMSLGMVDAVSGSSTTIVSPPEVTATNGVALNYRILTSPYPANVFKAVPLPPGLTINAGNGIIKGTPTQVGTWNSLITVSEDNLPERTAYSNIVWTVVSFAPIITNQPVSITTNNNSSVTLTVGADGGPPLKYQWQKNNANVVNATNAVLTFIATAATAGNYHVTVTNVSGTITSTDAAVVISAAPTITKQPATQTAVEGSGVTFFVNFTGIPAPTFQWKKGGVAIPGATSSSYTINNVSGADVGKYTVTLLNMAGTITSSAANLSILSPPLITLDPISQIVNIGDPVVFTAGASGSPAPTYQWQLNGVDIDGATDVNYVIPFATILDVGVYTFTASSIVGSVTSLPATLDIQAPPVIATQPISIIANVGDAGSLTVEAAGSPAVSYQWFKNDVAIDGATSSTLDFAALATSDAGVYYVSVSNILSVVISDTVSIQVNSAPSINTQPIEQTVVVGGVASFSVVVDGSPAPTVQWFHDGVAVPGGVTSSLVINNISASDAGNYYAYVENSVGNVTSSTVKLTVTKPPFIATQPVGVTITDSGSASFTVVADGIPAVSYQWKKNGNPIPGATLANYTILNVQNSDVGLYSVSVYNDSGSIDSSSVSLSIQYSVKIIAQPLGGTVLFGDPIILSIGATGSNLSYQWYKDTDLIVGAINSSLSFSSVNLSDSASYHVVVKNSFSTISSAVVSIKVIQLPSIITQPLSKDVTEGDTVSFSVSAGGVPAPTFQWTKNSVNIVGATGNVLSFVSTLGDIGDYAVKVSNEAGEVVSSVAHLNVNIKTSAPSITSQPIPQTVNEGANVSFSVVATGIPAPTYQWKKNGVAIAGAITDSLSLVNVKDTDSGDYSVTVSNGAGIVDSQVAKLVVNVVATVDLVLKDISADLYLVIFSVTGPKNAHVTIWCSNDLKVWGIAGYVTLDADGNALFSEPIENVNTRSYKAVID